MPLRTPVFSRANPDQRSDSTQENSDSINQQLYLARVFLHLMQSRIQASKNARIEYSQSQGRTNRIIHGRETTPVSIDEARERHAQRMLIQTENQKQREKLPQQIGQERIKETLIDTKKVALAEQPKPTPQANPEIATPAPIALTRMEPEALKTYLESQKIGPNGKNLKNVEITNFDFSGMDLRDFDLSNLFFENSNFNGAKMPSMTNVTFDHRCNLNNSDWSNTVQKDTQFGGSAYTLTSTALIESINQLQLLNSGDVSDFEDTIFMRSIIADTAGKDSTKIQESVNEHISFTAQKPETLRIANANFAGTKFENFFNYGDIDFSGSKFEGAVFKVIKAERKTNISSRLTAGIDLTGATLEFFDNQGEKIGESRGAKSLDLSSIDPGARELIGNCEMMSQEYYDKMVSGQEIVIKINADIADIPIGFQYQSISNNVTTSLKLTAEKIDEIQQEAVKIGDETFGRYNIKFVTPETVGDKIVDYTIHINLVDGIAAALADGDNSIALGPKSGLIGIDEATLGRDFHSTLSHEIGHLLLFQHPTDNFHTKLPSHMSYLMPMARSINSDNNAIISKNLIPFGDFTVIDQKVIEQYMGLFGRHPKIEKDLVSELDLETFGAISSYNPDPNFYNIVKIPIEVTDQDFRIILMNANDALAYCKSSNLMECETANGMENAQAIMVMNLNTKMVKSMAILAGENPKIQIGESELIDVRELILEDGFSVLDSSQNPDETMIYKYAKNKITGLQTYSDSAKLTQPTPPTRAHLPLRDDSSQDKIKDFLAEDSTQKTQGLVSQIGIILGASAVIVSAIGVATCASRKNRDLVLGGVPARPDPSASPSAVPNALTGQINGNQKTQ